MPPKATRSAKDPKRGKDVSFGADLTTELSPPPAGSHQRLSTSKKRAEDANRAAKKKTMRPGAGQQVGAPSVAALPPNLPSSPPQNGFPSAGNTGNNGGPVAEDGTSSEAGAEAGAAGASAGPGDEAEDEAGDEVEEEPERQWRIYPKWKLRVANRLVDESDLTSRPRYMFEGDVYESIVDQKLDQKLSDYDWKFEARAFKAWLGTGQKRGERSTVVPNWSFLSWPKILEVIDEVHGLAKKNPDEPVFCLFEDFVDCGSTWVHPNARRSAAVVRESNPKSPTPSPGTGVRSSPPPSVDPKLKGRAKDLAEAQAARKEANRERGQICAALHSKYYCADALCPNDKGWCYIIASSEGQQHYRLGQPLFEPWASDIMKGTATVELPEAEHLRKIVAHPVLQQGKGRGRKANNDNLTLAETLAMKRTQKEIDDIDRAARNARASEDAQILAQEERRQEAENRRRDAEDMRQFKQQQMMIMSQQQFAGFNQQFAGFKQPFTGFNPALAGNLPAYPQPAQLQPHLNSRPTSRRDRASPQQTRTVTFSSPAQPGEHQADVVLRALDWKLEQESHRRTRESLRRLREYAEENCCIYKQIEDLTRPGSVHHDAAKAFGVPFGILLEARRYLGEYKEGIKQQEAQEAARALSGLAGEAGNM